MPYEVLPDEGGRYEVLPPVQASAMDSIKQGAVNLGAGVLRGAGSIGATIAAPFDMIGDAMDGKGLSLQSNRERRDRLDENARNLLGADTNSWMYGGGKLAGEIAGTAGIGGVLGKGVQAFGNTRALSGLEPIVDGVVKGLQTGGFRVGDLAGTGLGALTRVGTGAAVGGAAAGMVNPQDAGMGALIGGGLPLAAQGAGKVGGMVRNGLMGGGVSDEVRQLATRAQELGITIPADRLTNSRPLNAVASSLNYIPLSGRAGTEDMMNSQLNRALSKTFGQDSSNVTMALRKAENVLGGKFENVLKNNTVAVDRQFFQELADVGTTAQKELGSDALKAVNSQIDEIIAKGASGQIDGQAAYNIKRTLDRLGSNNTPEAWHANELKKALMGALNRSLGPQEAQAFAQTRQQYGAMLDLQKLAKNGAEGEISVARLANMKNINNPQMQELADIAAQFVKPREGAHGAAQRVFGAGGAGMTAAAAAMGIPGAIPAMLGAGAVMGAGRAANGALNSQAMRGLLMGPLPALEPQAIGLLTQGAYRAAPLLGGQ